MLVPWRGMVPTYDTEWFLIGLFHFKRDAAAKKTYLIIVRLLQFLSEIIRSMEI